jgi:hypothetical protein
VPISESWVGNEAWFEAADTICYLKRKIKATCSSVHQTFTFIKRVASLVVVFVVKHWLKG